MYDSFVSKYGAITSQGNSRAFRDDSDYPLLCSLEEVDEDGHVTGICWNQVVCKGMVGNKGILLKIRL